MIDYYSSTHIPNTTELINNSSNETDAPSTGRDENLAKAEIGLLAAILFMAIFGNSIVLLVLCLRKKKLSRMNLLIVHLSIADLFVALFEVLPQLVWDITYRFMGNDFLCRTVKYMQLVAMYASSFVLVTTAIDRYIAIVHPLTSHTWTTRRVHLLVGVAWALSLLFAMPQLFLFAMREVAPGTGQYDCWENLNLDWGVPAYITWITISIYIIPSLILFFAYGKICFVVWRSVQFRESSQRRARLSYSASEKSSMRDNGKMASMRSNGKLTNGSSSNSTKASRKKGVVNTRGKPSRGMSTAKLKTVKMTMIVIICYLFCWSPFFIAQMWSAWDSQAPFTGTAFAIILLLASLNSCTNPWIYLFFSDNVGQQFCWCFGGGQRRMRGRYDKGSSEYDSDSSTRSTKLTNLSQYRGGERHSIPS